MKIAVNLVVDNCIGVRATIRHWYPTREGGWGVRFLKFLGNKQYFTISEAQLQTASQSWCGGVLGTFDFHGCWSDFSVMDGLKNTWCIGVFVVKI